MATATALPRAMAATYEDVERLVYDTTWKWIRSRGGEGDFDWWLSEANAAFIRAYEVYDRTKGAKFSTWCRSEIWLTFLDIERKQARAMKTTSIDGVTDPQELVSSYEWISHLSEHARFVADLAINTPDELAEQIPSSGEYRVNFKEACRDYLMDLGWTAKYITDIFEEIRFIINGRI